MLGRYQCDIAALSETRVADKTKFEEVGGGYTFYCIGKPEDDMRTSGVGLAELESLPWGISDRLMTLCIRIAKDRKPDSGVPDTKTKKKNCWWKRLFGQPVVQSATESKVEKEEVEKKKKQRKKEKKRKFCGGLLKCFKKNRISPEPLGEDQAVEKDCSTTRAETPAQEDEKKRKKKSKKCVSQTRAHRLFTCTRLFRKFTPGSRHKSDSDSYHSP
ncbi:uncharacterized protein V6R79_015982 [Siganus canaliculatus]